MNVRARPSRPRFDVRACGLEAAIGALLLVALPAAGCRRAPKERPPWHAPTFVAMERDFQEFREWAAVDLDDPGAPGVVHTAGRRKVFVSRRPPAGSTTFPVGTILVKEIEGAPADHHIFAMAKRGGGYNAFGAPGWEWFELRPRKDGSLAIAWRGFNPPPEEGYASDVNDGCNGCHNVARDNDHVRTPALSLKTFR
jgi:hypothetical protein